MSILQGNFLLLVPLYGIALVTLLIRDFRDYFGYLLMALCLMAVYIVIFGLSEHSFYAETGTAINRLLLQNVPVLVVTIPQSCQPSTIERACNKGPSDQGSGNNRCHNKPDDTESASQNLAKARPDLGNESCALCCKR
ncbi:MAG: hypothetical protein CM15mP103_11350 [Gammaproteobacteria bacterium]|nr:MAG: hypothetical protein CM15mP103_11350 [Gammaproteobacteria bacterium]